MRQITAVRYLTASRVLATTEQMQLVRGEDADTSGFLVPYHTTVLGVVCDLAANSIRFYVNDQTLRVTARAATSECDDPMACSG